MSLEPGVYIITSPALDKESVVARNVAEDLSLLPKKVVTVQRSLAASPLWVVEKVDEGRYKFIIGGDPTAALDGRLFAILLKQPPAEEWIVTYRENHEAYTIEKASREAGWVVDHDSPGSQVAVRPLIVGLSLPPYFPATELFKFRKVE